ncbi:MAG: tRNA (adenosine(37)-N6)-threonylcarbamoyltransferase complex ATPase subunit type 1 TsaE, partial [Planctomycetia bacterium]
ELECPNPEFVTSPTFVFMQEYPARIPVSHFDLYRLKDSMEFESMGGMELFAPETISIVEWPERLNGLLPVNRIELYFETKNSNARKITITGHGLASTIVQTKLMP